VIYWRQLVATALPVVQASLQSSEQDFTIAPVPCRLATMIQHATFAKLGSADGKPAEGRLSLRFAPAQGTGARSSDKQGNSQGPFTSLQDVSGARRGDVLCGVGCRRRSAQLLHDDAAREAEALCWCQQAVTISTAAQTCLYTGEQIQSLPRSPPMMKNLSLTMSRMGCRSPCGMGQLCA
jgi:hypothetical protein